AVAPRDAANVPPDGSFRHFHVPAGARGLFLQRLAPPSVAPRRQKRAQPVHARTRRRIFVAARPRLSRRLDDICGPRDGVCHADGQRLSAGLRLLTLAPPGPFAFSPPPRFAPTLRAPP